MMKKLLLASCFVLLLVLNVGRVECRRHCERRKGYKQLFVFGDSYVDAGNRPPTSQKNQTSRAWFYPYGSSDSAHHYSATGRFSDGLVQSDILAKILGRDESPPPNRLFRPQAQANDRDDDPSGVNFAVSGSRVSEGSKEAPSLGMQIDQLRRLVSHGIIDERDLDKSVALVSVAAGHDYYYMHVTDGASSDHVTDEIAECVRRLQEDVGVGKVLVNLLAPAGCLPWQSSANDYSHCESHANTLATMHNTDLKQKLDNLEDVLLLDLYTVFSDIIQSKTDLEVKRKYTPCCNAVRMCNALVHSHACACKSTCPRLLMSY